jgi:GT2 family glycosyltransferase
MISFIIPTFSRVDLLRQCLTSLARVEPDRSKYRIVIVHDGGPEKARAEIQRLFGGKAGIHLILKPNREGFSRAINSGFDASRDCQYVVLTNDDIHFTGPVIRGFDQVFKEDPLIGIVGCKLLHPDGTIQHAGVDWVPRPYKGVTVPIFYHPFYNKSRDHAGVNRACNSVVTAALMGVRMDMVRSGVRFDEKYFLAYEDVDFCLTAMKRGWRSVYRPVIVAVHHEGSTRAKTPDQMDEVALSGHTLGQERLIMKIRAGIFHPPKNGENR